MTENNLSQEMLQRHIDAAEAAIVADCAERDRLVAQIRSRREAVAQLQAQLGLARMQAMADVDWMTLLNAGSLDARKTLSQLLADSGFSVGGEWVDTGQTAIRFSLLKGRPSEVKRACLFVRQLLPHLVPFPDGTRRIGLFEHTLSYSASYHASFDEARQDYRLYARRGARHDVLFQADTLEALVQYVHDRHYYEVFRFPEDAQSDD